MVTQHCHHERKVDQGVPRENTIASLQTSGPIIAMLNDSACHRNRKRVTDRRNQPPLGSTVILLFLHEEHISTSGLRSRSEDRILRPHLTHSPNFPMFIRSSAARIWMAALEDLQSRIRDCLMAEKIESGVRVGCPATFLIFSSVMISESVWRKSR